MQVVTNTGWTVLGHIRCVRYGLVRNGYWMCALPCSNNSLQNPLHATTYLIISHYPIVVPPQKFYHI